MLDLIYLILIEPLEYGMKTVFEASFSGAGSYGISLILLSLAVSIVTFPLYYIAEIWQNNERLVAAGLAPKIKEIKSVFKGQERYMMLKTLFRQNQYHPIMAARTSFGFLIQIPFFFAAFHFLGNYAPLEKIKNWRLDSGETIHAF